MRRPGLSVFLGLVVFAAAAGAWTAAARTVSAISEADPGSATVTGPEWAVPRMSASGPEGAAVMASSDFAVGLNRVTFLLIRPDASVIRAPVADVYYQPVAGRTEKVVARLTSVGVKASAQEAGDATQIYVATLRFPGSGKYWVVIQPRGVAFQGFQILNVKRDPTAVAAGDRAPASNNPTTATERAERITTARPPDTALLRYSVADSLKKGLPFVVAFATPAYCESRTCGPVVDVLEAVRKRFERQGIRFIHIEIYEKNVPGNGVNRWVRDWKLPTEPWVFVVDRRGIVRDRFEGTVSTTELEQAVKKVLLGS